MKSSASEPGLRTFFRLTAAGSMCLHVFIQLRLSTAQKTLHVKALETVWFNMKKKRDINYLYHLTPNLMSERSKTAQAPQNIVWPA